MHNTSTLASLAFAALMCAFLGACGTSSGTSYPDQETGAANPDPFGRVEESPGLFGSGFKLFGGGRNGEDPERGVAVNTFLWRASLDTLDFMPLASADPFGGTIITDWFASPQTPDERFKVTVYILDKRLRADGLRVSVFRQTRGSDGVWADAMVDPTTPQKLENAILSKARQMRLATIDE